MRAPYHAVIAKSKTVMSAGVLLFDTGVRVPTSVGLLTTGENAQLKLVL